MTNSLRRMQNMIEQLKHKNAQLLADCHRIDADREAAVRNAVMLGEELENLRLDLRARVNECLTALEQRDRLIKERDQLLEGCWRGKLQRVGYVSNYCIKTLLGSTDKHKILRVKCRRFKAGDVSLFAIEHSEGDDDENWRID